MPIQLAELLMPNSTFLKVLYAGNLLWHTSAVVHFGFRGPFMMRKLSTRAQHPSPAIATSPAGDGWHTDLMKYLAGMNSALALLALLRLTSAPLTRSASTLNPAALEYIDVMSLTVLGLANASQAFLNFTVGAMGDRWICGHGLDRITVLDALFTVLDWSAAIGIAL